MGDAVRELVDDFVVMVEAIIERGVRERLAGAASFWTGQLTPPPACSASPARAPKRRRAVSRPRQVAAPKVARAYEATKSGRRELATDLQSPRARAPLDRKGSDRPTSTTTGAHPRVFQGGRPVEREKASGDEKAAPRVRSGKDEQRRTAQGAISTSGAGAPGPEEPTMYDSVPSRSRRIIGILVPDGINPAPAAGAWRVGETVIARLGGEDREVTIESPTMKAGMWRVRTKDKRLFVALESAMRRP